MSELPHCWKVVRCINGWTVEHTGRTKMRFQPDQYGKLSSIYWSDNESVLPMGPHELRLTVRNVHARMLGKRFGNRFSEERRNVCCEYAAELNKEA